MDSVDADVVKFIASIHTVPPLSRIASVRVAAHLWCQPDVLNDFKRFDIFPSRADNSILQRHKNIADDRVCAKLAFLGITQGAKDSVQQVIQPVGSSILHWMMCHAKYFMDSRISVFDYVASSEMHWKWCGIVDNCVMASDIAVDKRVCVTSRFQLASLHCLEEELHALWVTMTPEQRKMVCGPINDPNVSVDLIVLYWASFMRDGTPRREFTIVTHNGNATVSIEDILTDSCKRGYLSSVKYFLHQIGCNSSAEECLVTATSQMYENAAAHSENYYSYHENDLFAFLLNAMAIDDSANLASKILDWGYRPYTLIYFVKWPFQHLFDAAFEIYSRTLLSEVPSTTVQYSLVSHNMWTIMTWIASGIHPYSPAEFRSMFLTVWYKFSSIDGLLQRSNQEQIALLCSLLARSRDEMCLQHTLEKIIPMVNIEAALSSSGKHCANMVIESNWEGVGVFVKFLVPKTRKWSLFLFVAVKRALGVFYASYNHRENLRDDAEFRNNATRLRQLLDNALST